MRFNKDQRGNSHPHTGPVDQTDYRSVLDEAGFQGHVDEARAPDGEAGSVSVDVSWMVPPWSQRGIPAHTHLT